MIFLDNHISVTSEKDILEICKPLFSATDVSYFIFARFYDDGSHISLPSNSKWHIHFWEKGYHKNSRMRLSQGRHLWNLEEKFSSACDDARRIFGIDNRFDIVERGENYYDIFGFGSCTGNSRIIDYYFNHANELKKFVFYFKEKASFLIKQCDKEKNKLFIEEIKHNNVITDDASVTSMNLSIRQFKLPFCTLSKRELECLLLLLRGRTAAEMGILLNISQKTAESYIECVKYKFECETRAKLFDKAYKMGIIELAKDFSLMQDYG